MACRKCKNLSIISETGYRYCKKEQHYGPINGVDTTPKWCPELKSNNKKSNKIICKQIKLNERN